MARVVRIGGIAAMVGGALWVVSLVLYALGPSGPGVSPPYREFGLLSGPMLLAATALLIVGVLGLWANYGNQAGGMRTGVAILAVAGAALFMGAMFAELPWTLVMLGFYGSILGTFLMGVVALQAGALPRVVTVALMAGSVALFFFNTETSAVWLAIPFGIAWMAVGYALFRERTVAPAVHTARVG